MHANALASHTAVGGSLSEEANISAGYVVQPPRCASETLCASERRLTNKSENCKMQMQNTKNQHECLPPQPQSDGQNRSSGSYRHA